MEGNMDHPKVLEDVLSEKHIHQILAQTSSPGSKIIGYDLKPAAQGLSGFLGDHFRVTLRVKDDQFVKKVHLFLKTVPRVNKPKAEFINQNNYFRREALMFGLFEEMKGTKGPNPWCTKAYIHNENILVMPDLSIEGYKLFPLHAYLDIHHVLVTVSALARFHAAFANYITKKSSNRHRTYSLLDDYEQCMREPTFCDSPWLRAAAKLTSNFLKEFSSKSGDYPIDLESELYKLFIEACDSLRVYEDTLNVAVHKDLWVNNILFQYTCDVPTNAILIDYQCMRYAPPAFDLMIFLYLTTSRSFREHYEHEIFSHYYSIFSLSVDDATNKRLRNLNYDKDSFFGWCESARLFGMLETMTIFPYVLMEPTMAQKTFDDPETYLKYLEEDRTDPVLAHARTSAHYRERQLEVSEEFVERYILV